ncbi:MAG: hypothetical protein ABIH70_02180 [Chloroflexota bacterium]
MDDKAKKEIYSLEQSILGVVDQSKKVASMIDVEPDLLEDLRQIAIALHYTMQALRLKLGLPNVRRTSIVPMESSSDLRMTTELPLKTESELTVNPK